jgi:hypothetical protein
MVKLVVELQEAASVVNRETNNMSRNFIVAVVRNSDLGVY